ncbi:MAG: quinonprotein alcohol dehydrogenase [Planctomycetota bacterium]|nr:MAG: quinonprotein alcohol dehydrogenase [Planctomycetota bacterium]
MFAVWVSLCGVGALLAGENWPAFRGPTGDGHSDATGLPTTWSETENIAWKTPLQGRAWSSPVIWGSEIWLTNATEDGKTLSALVIDRDSGKLLHDLPIFSVEKSQVMHKFNSYASPTPVIEAGRVYLSWGAYGVACLDTATQKTIWVRRDLPCEHFRGPGSSPILHGNLLIQHYDGFDYQYVVALDKRTGKTVWKTDRPTDFGTTDGDVKKAYATPIVISVNGREQLISPASKGLFSYDVQTGAEIWRVTYPTFSSPTRPLFHDGMLIFSGGFSKGILYAVRADGQGDVTDTHVVWKEDKAMPSKPSPLLVDGLVYTIQDQGVAMCLEEKTGQQVWQARLGGNYSASPVYADGKLYFLSEEGKTSVVAPGREYRLLAENSLPDGFMASPAVAGKALYLRTRTALYRVESR